MNSEGFAVGGYGATIVGTTNQGAAYMQTLTYLRQTIAQSSPATNDYFGEYAVIDNDTMAVGAQSRIYEAIWMFRRSATTGSWAQEGTIIQSPAGSGVSSNFGSAIAISGNVMVVGASQATVSAQANSGVAYFYTRSGSTWSGPTTISSPEAAQASNFFGATVSFDGTTLAIGAYGRTGSFAGQGRVYLYSWNGTTFSHIATVNAANATAINHNFGNSVAIKNNVLLISSRAGFVYYYNKGAGWVNGNATPITLTSGTPLAADLLGTTNRMAFDGTTMVVGASGGTYALAFTYNSSTGSWVDTKLTPSDATSNMQFGAAVTVSGDYVGIGAEFAGAGVGHAYIFKKSGSGYVQHARYVGNQATASRFGSAVVLDGTGQLLLGSELLNTNTGALYAYSINASPLTQCGYAEARSSGSAKYSGTTNSSSLATPLIVRTPVGQTLFACVGIVGTTITNVIYGGVTNTTPIVTALSTGTPAMRVAIYAFPNTSGAEYATSVTVTTGNVPNSRVVLPTVVQGIPTTSYLDGTSSGQSAGTNGTTATTGSVTTTNANNLLISCAGNNALADTTSYWVEPMTHLVKDSTSGTASGTGHVSLAFGSKPVTATATYTASRSGFTSSQWAIATAALKTTGTLPTTGGACTTDGACAVEGALNYNTSNNKLYWCDGNMWNQVHSVGGPTPP